MSHTLTRPSTTAAMRNAAGRGTSANSSTGCKDCVKQGLAILPVVPTPVPLPLRGKSEELTHLDNRYIAPDLKDHWLVLRTLPAGYLYVMKPDLTWDVYVVDVDGMLRLTAPADAPPSPLDQAPLSELCKRGGDNVPAQVIAIDPVKYSTVWMAFSRYRWTTKVMRDYAANKEGCRDRRMSKLDVAAAAAGSLGTHSKAANAVRFGAPMSAGVGTLVADYASRATCDLLNKNVVTPIRYREQFAAPLAAKMAEISRRTQGKTGAVIALTDDLGLAIDLNAERNTEVAGIGAYMQAHQRERMVSDVIMGFEKSFTENGEGDKWTERYVKHYDRAKLLVDRQAYDDEVESRNEKIAGLSADVALALADAKLKPIWHDFDPADHQSARDRQEATAWCLHGATKTKAEHALWDGWFGEDAGDAYATLWGAATALDPEFGEFMLGKELPEVGKLPQTSEVVKQLHEAHEEFHEWLELRKHEQALPMLGTAMASQIARVQITNPALYRVAGLRVIMIASVRTSVTITPVSIAMTRTRQAMLMAEAAFGPPKPQLTRLLDAELQSSKRVFIVGTNGVDAYASTTTITEKVRAVEMWLPEEMAEQLRLPAPVAPLLLAPPRINPYSGLVRFSKTASGVLAWVGLTLWALNLGNSIKELSEEKEGDHEEAWFGVVSGTFAVSGLIAEITAGAMKKMTTRFVANSWAKVGFFGGVLAGLTSMTEGIEAIVKAHERHEAGDDDAMYYYSGASFLLIASGIAGFGGALAAGAAPGATALTGALGFLLPLGEAAAFVPVWGWIICGAILLAAGIYLLWKAVQNTDDPIEEWLKCSLYGNGPKRFSIKEEMEALNGIVYAMTVEVEWSGDPWELVNKNFYDDYDEFKFSISLPRLGAASVIDCKLTLLGNSKPLVVWHETIRPRGNGDDPHQTVVSAAGPPSTRNPDWIWQAPPMIRHGEEGTRYGGVIRLNDDIYDEAQVHVMYWPDAEKMPDFVLPEEGQQTLVGKK